VRDEAAQEKLFELAKDYDRIANRIEKQKAELQKMNPINPPDPPVTLGNRRNLGDSDGVMLNHAPRHEVLPGVSSILFETKALLSTANDG
jgi:hypothetical protein